MQKTVTCAFAIIVTVILVSHIHSSVQAREIVHKATFGSIFNAVQPTPEPTVSPLPTLDPSALPTILPSPTPQPTPLPTPLLTPAPTPLPTPLPIPAPTPEPTVVPVSSPTPLLTTAPIPTPTETLQVSVSPTPAQVMGLTTNISSVSPPPAAPSKPKPVTGIERILQSAESIMQSTNYTPSQVLLADPSTFSYIIHRPLSATATRNLYALSAILGTSGLVVGLYSLLVKQS